MVMTTIVVLVETLLKEWFLEEVNLDFILLKDGHQTEKTAGPVVCGLGMVKERQCRRAFGPPPSTPDPPLPGLYGGWTWVENYTAQKQDGKRSPQ